MPSPDQTTDGILNRIRSRMTSISPKKQAQLDRVDQLLDRIQDEVQDKDSLNFAETFRSIISNSLSKHDFNSAPPEIYQSIDQTYRMVRYNNAEDIVDTIPYCAKALRVIRDGIISPDDITKRTLQVLQGEGFERENDKKMLKDVKDIIEYLDVETILPEIVEETLKMGDQFIEIADYTSEDIPLSQALLTENSTEEEIKSLGPFEETCRWNETIIENGRPREQPVEIKVQLDLIEAQNVENLIGRENLVESFNILDEDEKSDLKKKIDRKKKEPKKIKDSKEDLTPDAPTTGDKPSDFLAQESPSDIKNVRLIVHDPRYVVKLQSKRFKMSLGYLVMPATENTSMSYPGSGNSGGSPTRQLYGASAGMAALYPTMDNSISGVDALYKDLIGKVKKSIEKTDITINQQEVKDILARVVKELQMENDPYNGLFRLKIRYVPEHKMEHWKVRSRRFYPYGESIYFKSTFPAKLYVTLQTAITVRRISDSTDKRIIYVETGLPRDVRSHIEEVRSSFSKRKHSLDMYGSISSIPSSMTTFENIYIPVVNGKKTIEFDTLAPTINFRDATEELKTFRDGLVSSIDVPPPYLNIEENISNKASLSFENSLFAQTLISYQQMFSIHLRNLISKIYKMVRRKELPKNINVTFNPPKMLQMEREVEKMDMYTRMVQGYNDLGVPKDYAVRKLMDMDINWDDVEAYKTKANLQRRMSSGAQEVTLPGSDPSGGASNEFNSAPPF